MRSASERRSVGMSPALSLSLGSDSSSLLSSSAGNGPAQSSSGGSGWWFLLPVICFFQLFLLYRWSLVSSMVIADHRLLYRKARDVSLIQQAVEEKVLPAAGMGFGNPDAFVRALVSNVSARLEGREVELVNLGFKLLEREKELTRLHGQLLDFLGKPRTGSGAGVVRTEGGQLVDTAAGSGGGGGGGLAGDPQDNFPPAPVVPAQCARQQDVGRKGKVKWHAKPGRYLLAMCSGGQLSNRISCIRQNMLDAALLNRTLVLPSHGVDYNYDSLLDMTAPKTCFGDVSFMTLDEFALKVKPTKVRGRTKPALMFVDVFVCHVHSFQTAKICAKLIPKYEDLGIRFAKPIIPDFRTPSPWYKYKAPEVLAKFNFPDAQVVAFGNMFGVAGADLRFRGSQPLAVTPACKYYVMPSKPIMETAAGFINTFMGTRYISLHLRRGDFYDHCVIKHNSAKPCYHPLHQVARCIRRRLHENPGIQMVYISTNADELEVQVLRELVQARTRGGISLVRMPVLETQAWAEPLIRLNLHKEPEVVSLVEKTISVMATVFYGTAGSTYTGDINRLRDWLLTRSCADANICPDEEPADTRSSLT